MDNCIIITVNMFARDSQVLVVDSGSSVPVGKYSIEQLPLVIAELAHKSNIYAVKIAGGEKYSQLIQYGIEQSEMTKYNERKIEVEVI